MSSRTSEIHRKTNETDISLVVDLDGKGKAVADTDIGFLNHMIETFARHALIDLDVSLFGDIHVDNHHSVEDTGIVLGMAVDKALGDRAGITRFGSAVIPMDEALILCAMDISGRGALYWDVDLPFGAVGDFDTELVEEFFTGFARNAGITLHIKELEGKNAHHIIEASFKAVARALRQAITLDPRLEGEIPSTKGTI